jgi:fluoroacetyl-CoA thioesterase
MKEISVGLKHEVVRLVEERFTAFHIGSETIKVLSTPSMIGFMERASLELVQPYLAEGQTTVGTLVNVRHLAATPMGQAVRVISEVVEVEGRRLVFHVEVWDAQEKAGEGLHERFVIDMERYLKRVQAKIQPYHS